jgi:shikimate 5-dehydrogenase
MNPGAANRRFLTGLLGAPIAQSASPAMHERAAAALGLHCHYRLIEVAGAGHDELKTLLEGVRRLGFSGITAARAKGARVMTGRELASIRPPMRSSCSRGKCRRSPNLERHSTQ